MFYWQGLREESPMIQAHTFLLYGHRIKLEIHFNHLRKDAIPKSLENCVMIPCRTANRGSFPLNGTYFQVNEVFADHESRIHLINIPRSWIWRLVRRTAYFGTSTTAILKGIETPEIGECFSKVLLA